MGRLKKGQKQIEAVLEPWLEFAKLVPFDSDPEPPWRATPDTVESVFQGGANPIERSGRVFCHGFPAEKVFEKKAIFGNGVLNGTENARASLARPIPLAGLSRNEAAMTFYSLLHSVRSVLRAFLGPAPDGQVQGPGHEWQGYFPSGSMLVSKDFGFNHKGRFQQKDNPAWESFLSAFDGVERVRIRVCEYPRCGCFYYAGRKNKKACNRHLKAASVYRARKNQAKYNETRKTKRRMQKARQKNRPKLLSRARPLSVSHR